MVATFVGSDTWNAEVYSSLAFASRLAAAVKQRQVVYKLSFFFWRMNERLDSLFSEIYSILEKNQIAPDQAIEPKAIENAIDQLMHMHRILDSIYTAAKRSRLENNTITAGGVRRLYRNNERLLELAGWLSDILHSEELEPIFDSARAEHDRGETVSLAG
jgi:hypothetical protein